MRRSMNSIAASTRRHRACRSAVRVEADAHLDAALVLGGRRDDKRVVLDRRAVRGLERGDHLEVALHLGVVLELGLELEHVTLGSPPRSRRTGSGMVSGVTSRLVSVSSPVVPVPAGGRQSGTGCAAAGPARLRPIRPAAATTRVRRIGPGRLRLSPSPATGTEPGNVQEPRARCWRPVRPALDLGVVADASHAEHLGGHAQVGVAAPGGRHVAARRGRRGRPRRRTAGHPHQVGVARVDDVVDLGAVRMPPTASTGIATRLFTAWKRLRFQTGRKGRSRPRHVARLDDPALEGPGGGVPFGDGPVPPDRRRDPAPRQGGVGEHRHLDGRDRVVAPLLAAAPGGGPRPTWCGE